MSHFTAFLLGLIQGLTEFFPISSSAHLELAKRLFGLKEISPLFDLSCHLGTLCTLFFFFRKDILRLFSDEKHKLPHLFLALIPLIPFYFLFQPLSLFIHSPISLGLFLMLTGGILFLGYTFRFKKNMGTVGHFLAIGTAQAAAMIPGISRSASTISCARILGWELKDAIRFSFLLAIPTIACGNLVKIFHLLKLGKISQIFTVGCLIGAGAAFCAGLVIIPFAIKWLEKGNLNHFAWYCLLLGFIVTLYVYLHP